MCRSPYSAPCSVGRRCRGVSCDEHVHVLVMTRMCKILRWKPGLQQPLWWAMPILQTDQTLAFLLEIFPRVLVCLSLLKEPFFGEGRELQWPKVEWASQVWQNLCLAKIWVSQAWGLGKGGLAGKPYLQAFKVIHLKPCSAPVLQTIIFPRTWYFKTHYIYLICLPPKRPSGRFVSDLLCPYWGEEKQIIKPQIQPAIWMGSMRKKA